MRRRRRSAVVGLLCALADPMRAQERAGRPTVVTVVDAAGAALAHAVVEVRIGDARAALARALTDERGRARVVVPAADGTMQIVVRRLGYRAVRLPVSSEGTATVRLDRVPHQLAPMAVRSGPSRCQPGFVPHDADSTVALLVEAIAAHAAQDAALRAQHPWRAAWRFDGRHHTASGSVVRAFAARLEDVDARSDTLGYLPGRLVERRGLGHVKVRWEQLRDLASPAFLAHHCFRTGDAPDTALGRPAVSLVFRADRTLRTADIDGAVLLDATTHEPLKLVLGWVHLPMGFRAMQEVVRFCRIAPGVVVPVARRLWQTYTQAQYWNDEAIAWSSGERVLASLTWLDTPPPGIGPSFDPGACPGVENAAGRGGSPP